jgi:GTP pyrophosphokinase
LGLEGEDQSPRQLSVTTTNKPGILATVSQTFSAQSINISEANCRAGEDGSGRENVFHVPL